MAWARNGIVIVWQCGVKATRFGLQKYTHNGQGKIQTKQKPYTDILEWVYYSITSHIHNISAPFLNHG